MPGKKRRTKQREKTAGPQPRPPEPAREPAAEGTLEAAPAACPVAGFGASAGGLEAFTDVLQHLPEDTGLAFVFIQHLDPRHASVLTELLSRATRMPVTQVTQGVQLEPNRVYVIPPNSCLSLHEGSLRVEPRPPGTPHMPIDHFFRSLAAEQGSKAIGVVLSGTASDGTLGLKAIKAGGGITFAQDPETAKYDGMPRNAIAAGCVDAALKPEAIAAELVRLCRHPYLSPPPMVEERPAKEPDLNEIFAMLRSAKGVDFAHYKPGTIQRRTLRRMALHKMETPEQYVQYLKGNPRELDLLFQDILINVTGFFREPATFTAVKSLVLPALLKNRSPEDAVRIWVPGCSTGEEVYSIAICLLEQMREASIEVPVQVFGTDLSEAALEKARAGVYPESIAADVSPERLRRFFVRVNGLYQIARSVRDMCIFALQNVTKDPPFSKLDLITCRNVLIYLGPALQTKVLRMFHYALKPAGFLVLGASESIGGAGELFSLADKQHRIYSRRAAVATITTDFGLYEEAGIPEPAARAQGPAGTVDVARKVDQMMLASYSPPAMLVDKDLTVLQFRGRTSPYLAHPSGDANLNLLKLTPGSLGIEIRKLVDRARAQGASVRGGPVSVPSDDAARSVTVSVMPVHGMPEPLFLVVFEDGLGRAEQRAPKASPPLKRPASAGRIRDLEEELIKTRQYLQSVIEEQETANEELKSAQEELQSSNEELQSTNEELLTAKEELQSTNEELSTVNDEMQSRNAELQQINNDLVNLLSSVNIPIVMLGSDLSIRRYTPQAERILNLIPADVGRPISDFKLKINVPDLVELCRQVIDNLTAREREVQDSEGRVYSMWVRPYRTMDNRIDGVLLALFDLTERKQAAEARYRRLFEAAKDGIVIADAATGEIVDSNPFISKLFGHPRSSLMGARYWESRLFRGSEMDESLLKELQERESVQKTVSLPTDAGEQLEVEIVASLYAEGERSVIQFNIRDISARRRAEERLQRSQEQLRQRQKMEAVGRLAGGVAHDFNNVLTAIVGYADLLGQELEENHAGQEMVKQIALAAERAVALTNQLLAFGRKGILSPELLDAGAVIAEMRQMISVTLSNNVELVVECQPELKRVRADRTQLEQVILNLALNARDAMPGGGTITIAARNVDVDERFFERHPAVPVGKYVAISVTDTGSGMDEDTQAHLFEPFFTTKPKGSGVGLGLSTVYGIVKRSGGYIWAYSELGVGSSFTVYLPAVDAESEDAGDRIAGKEQARGTGTILLVDDEQMVRSLARRFLETQGYRVLEASGGPEALQMSREYKGQIHLLVTDVVMPRMSGRELAFQLAAERPEMQVLYVSGHTEELISHHGVLKDRLAFLPKPFTKRVLVERVGALLAARAQPESDRRRERPGDGK
ncbi:MAG: PAS domain-containing protein [Bryobacterales bacterium]|nr:PAS domain-containing protein [Bryobacterales bacterium]